MEGCSKYCSFCVVPYTRGPEISRPFDDVLAEVAQLAAQGVREVNLLGQNVNAYRGMLMDDDGEGSGQFADLALLIRAVAQIDSIGRILSLDLLGDNNWWLKVQAPPELDRYLVFKGSVAIDGISLTVNRVDARSFAVSLIPHTQAVTTLDKKGAGAEVNLEVDLIGKYVEKLLGGHARPDSLQQKLKEHGFDHE